MLRSPLLRKFYFGVWKRIYCNDIIGLYEMKNHSKAISPAILIKEVTSENIKDALTFQSNHELVRFQLFLNEGDTGFYAYLHGQCAHRSWVMKHPRQAEIHLFYSKLLLPNEVFVHFCETAPWARGKNIFTSVLNHIGSVFRDQRILICVEQSNKSSIRSIKKSGFIEINRFRIIALLGIRIVRNMTISN
ncbi:MAG: hypothetical protein HY015_04980 [Bacteroidetes bacterium]|nr:hypothetical protein [Bacteroidota bacterium]MBI3482315.1 hypothetical protein [Bacteroidota bacterium]